MSPLVFLPWIKTAAKGLAASVAMLLAMGLGLLVYGRTKHRAGAKEARSLDREMDYENAEDIRDRTDRGLVGKLREYDGAGFRD